nr:CMESO_355 [Cryptomonas curvata]
MYSKSNSIIKKVTFKKFIKIILGKVIEKKKIISVLNSKKKNIFKLIISDSSGCTDIFSTVFANIRIGDIVKISKLKIFFHRNSFKIIGLFCEFTNLSPYNNPFTINFQNDYSKKKYKIFFL